MSYSSEDTVANLLAAQAEYLADTARRVRTEEAEPIHPVLGSTIVERRMLGKAYDQPHRFIITYRTTFRLRRIVLSVDISDWGERIPCVGGYRRA